MEKPDKELFDKVVKISQARGFVFNASSIYGGLRSSYDYGPLGTILKQNISKYCYLIIYILIDCSLQESSFLTHWF